MHRNRGKAENRTGTGPIETVNVDLIFNFPFQTPEIFASDIKLIKEMASIR